MQFPVAIMLIVLGILNKYIKDNSIIYGLTILFTGVISVLDALVQVGLNVEFLNNLLSKLPLYSQGLSWLPCWRWRPPPPERTWAPPS